MSTLELETMDRRSEVFMSILRLSATVSTLGMFLTGVAAIRLFHRKGNTGDYSCIPYIMGALNCASWLKYGLLIDEAAIQVRWILNQTGPLPSLQLYGSYF